MEYTQKEYIEYVKGKSPNSPLGKNMLRAFGVGGLICCVGQLVGDSLLGAGMAEDTAAAFTSISLVFIGAVLTGLGVYDDIGRFAGAGALVPITGFANAVAAPAVEFKSEGLITGTAVKMFTIAGPVIVYGVAASVLYGVVLVLFGAG
ncbi:MAG: SpoVA/SpoVAEb family sporulation membrane protein [Oscillospiraceae bacterium]|nr:SpoVA/SpoVAEb family sporulation membrane protein [Oscillospiraceae bacterium]